MRNPEDYDNERDMARFWEAVRIRREPMKARWYLPALLLVILVSIPWYWRAGEAPAVIGGLPIWAWITLGCSFVVSCLTAIAILFFWRDDPGADEGESSTRERR